MPFTFYAEDNEFAASTDDNVNSGNGTSTFDYPPTSTTNLVITSQSDDDDARLFDLGDVYTLSFQGNGGTTIQNATVIRSDPLSGNEGAIVFEGVDPDGELVQVVWSPNFDLEAWYFANFNQGQSPGFYTTDQNEAEYRFACFAKGTLMDTVDGPRPVETLQTGDLVPTRDGGVQPVLWVATSTVPGIGRASPVTISPGVLGAVAPVVVSPQHRLLISDPRCQFHFDAPEVFIAACHLVDGEAVRRETCKHVTYVHVLFERHEVVLTQGVYSESLLLGDDMRGILSDAAHDRFKAAFGGRFPARRAQVLARRPVRKRHAPLVRNWLGLRVGAAPCKPPSFFFAA